MSACLPSPGPWELRNEREIFDRNGFLIITLEGPQGIAQANGELLVRLANQTPRVESLHAVNGEAVAA